MSVLNKVNVISSIGYDCKICQKLSHDRQENIAGVFSTYAHSWLTSGPDLFIVSNSDGVLQSYWTFGENLQDDLEITCAVELPLEGCAIPLLILGISSENVNLLCFFNPNTRKILRTIDIIYPVRTLCVIEDGTNEVYPLNDTLTPTEGLIAVGCAEGTILLIDLCRSILCKAVNGDFRFYSTEENPCEIVYVGINSVTSGGFSQKIVESRKKKNCVSVILTDPSDDGITALLYSVESAVLFVGTSSGSFHLWNMSSLSCLFKSPATNRAIISLSLLEPCDDPRHNLYLWICFEEYAQVAMYSISFSSKFFVHGYGVYYQNFESAGLVYRFTLGMEVDVIAKRPICSQAVAKLVPKNLVRCISLPEAEGTHLRLFITAYEIIDKGQISIRALVFDLNQWYRDQMPEEGVSSCLDSIDIDSKGLWHLQLDPTSLSLYQCVRPQEQHFHPTAFDFQVWCVEEEGIRCLEKLGLQTQWLRNMSRMGSKALVEPTQIFLGALAAGLLPSFIDPPDPEANDEVEERSYVLTICLENRMIMVIEDCVKDWNSGGYTVRGCTIQFLLDWLWNLHRAYKANGNKICVPLFDQSGMKFDVSEKRSLQHCKSLLNTVQSVYTEIANRYKNNIIVSGIEEKMTAMSLVRLYFDCCLKLISVHLLPEPNDMGRPSDSLVYHFDNINTYAINRRKVGPFLGDSLLGRTDAEKQWLEEGGTGLYPPPSIQSVLRFCIHPSPSIVNKMSLLLYLFMDIINSYSPIRSQPVLDRIKNFQHLMRIPEVQYKIVAGCWYLDHSMFDEGVELLFDPRVLCVDLSEDQHRGILHLLASEGQEKLALQYLRLKSPTLNLAADLRMELNLLLSNGLVNEAFLFQRKHPEMRETLLIEFFEGCIERKQLGQVFGLNLDFKEEAALMKYLKSSHLKEKGDLQVLLLLSKAKYTEAMFLNDKLNSSINGPKSRIQRDTRDMIVRGITGSLNTISRHIANEMKVYRPPPAGSHPRPLSSFIKVRNGPDGPLCQTDSKVLLSAVAKSTRHLSDFVNSFESGHRRKREEDDKDIELENEPSRKRLKLLDSASNINIMPSLNGKWVTSPCKQSSSQKRDVMELVGTPLVKKHGKRFSPQSRPSSILKGKTPEKHFITEDFGETPKKSIRFALPENEIEITARKPLRENETTVPNQYTKNTVDSKEESLTPLKEEFIKPSGLGKPSARKPLHGSDSLNNSMAAHNSSSVIENIKDRLRSSAKKKVLEDGVNWHEVAEASKPRVLFTPGVNKITPIIKSDKASSSTPMSQALLDITVTSAEKKYLDSPSRGEETSPVTEALFNTTLLPKVLFSSVNKETEIKTKSPEDVTMHASFLDRYKQLRNKNAISSNSGLNLKEKKERGVRFEPEQSFSVVCYKKTIDVLKGSETISSTNIVIEDDEPIKEDSILKEDSGGLDKPPTLHKNESGSSTDNEEVNNGSLLEEKEVHYDDVQKESLLVKSVQILVNENLHEEVDISSQENDPLLTNDVSPCINENEFLSEKQELLDDDVSPCVDENEILPEKQDSLDDDVSPCVDENEILPEKQELLNDDVSPCIDENEFLSEKQELLDDDVSPCVDKNEILPEKQELLNDDVSPCIDENDILSEKQDTEIEWSGLKLEGVEGNFTFEDPVDGCDIIGYNKTYLDENKPLEVLPSVASNSENIKDKNILLDNSELLKRDVKLCHDDLCTDVSKTSLENEAKEVSSDSKKDCEEIIEIASDDDEDDDDKQSYDDSLTDEETEGMSGEYSEEIEEEMSEKEENGSENEGSLPDVSSISSDGDDVENLNESTSVNCCQNKSPEKEIKKKENVDSKKGAVGALSIVLSDADSGDDTSKNKKKGSGKKTSNLKTRKSKTSSQHEQSYEEDVLDIEVFGLKNEISGNKEEGHSEDDMWIGLEGKDSFGSKNENISEHSKCNDYDLSKSESSHKAMLQNNLGSHRKEIGNKNDIPVSVSNAVPNALCEQGIFKFSTSVNMPEEKFLTGNQGRGDHFFVKGPVIESVSSFSVEHPITEAVSEEETLVKESVPISMPLIAEVSSLHNEDLCNEKYLSKSEDDLDLREDYQSIEQNWTRQIEEEMKQDSAILNIESENHDSINISSKQLLIIDGNEIISKELNSSKPSDESECKGFENSKKLSSLHTLEVEHTQNNLISDELKNQSRNLEIDREDFSIKGTNNLPLEDEVIKREEMYEGEDLDIVKENIVSYNKEMESSKGEPDEASLKVCQPSEEAFEKQSVAILKDSAIGKQVNTNATCYEPEKPNDCDSAVYYTNREKDCPINISKDNDVIRRTAVVVSSLETFTKHSEDSFNAVEKEKNFSLEASSTNMVCNIASDVNLSEFKEYASNKNENFSAEKNSSRSVSEKCKILCNNLLEVNFIPVEAETNEPFGNIDKGSNAYLESANEDHDSLASKNHINTSFKVNKNDNTSINMTTSSKIIKIVETKITKHEEEAQKNDSDRIFEKDNSKKDDTEKGNMFLIGETITSSQDEIGKPKFEVISEFEVLPIKLSIDLEESTKAKTLDASNMQLAEKGNSTNVEVPDTKAIHNTISEDNLSKNFATISEVINVDTVLSCTQTNPDSSKVECHIQSKKEDNNDKNRTDDRVLASRRLSKENELVITQTSASSSIVSDHSCQENNFKPSIKVIHSDCLVPGSDGISKSSLFKLHTDDDDKNVSKTNPIVHESNAREDKTLSEENNSLYVRKEKFTDKPLDCQLNNAKIDVYNDTSKSGALNPSLKETNLEEINVQSAENSTNVCPGKTFVEKSFFFGKEDIETYIRSTKATFQIGGRMSLPEEDEPVDPMEVAMIEDEEKMLTEPSPSEPDIDLSLHLSPEHSKKPKKVDQGIVTENSYLQRRARKLKKSAKKLLGDESFNKKLETKIIVNSEDHILGIDNAMRCISTQTSGAVLGEIDLSESDEELIDYTKVPGPSQKSSELRKNITRKMRPSSEPPFTHKEDLKRKSSTCSQKMLEEQDAKRILKNKNLVENFHEEVKTQSKADHLPVRRSRRLSETNEHLRNQYEKDHCIKTQRRSRGYSEEPDYYRFSSQKEKESDGYYDSEKQKKAIEEDIINKKRRSRRPSEEPELRSILKKSSRGSRKSSLSSGMINELQHDEEADSRQEGRKLRSQSEEPEPLGIPKKRYRHSRRNSYTFETAAEFNSQVEEIPIENRKLQRYSEHSEIQGILNKQRSGISKSSLSSEATSEVKTCRNLGKSEESRERQKYSEGEIQGILKKSRTSDYDPAKIKLLADVLPDRKRRSRRHSEEPEMLKTLQKRERRGSQSSDIDNEVNDECQEGIRQIRWHSEEPEVRGILKKRSSTFHKSSFSTETASNSKLLKDGLSYESRKFKDQTEESDVKGILKKSKNSRRKNSNASEVNKGLLQLERESPEHKNNDFLDHDSHKLGKKSNASSKTYSVNSAKTLEGNEFDEECLSLNTNTLESNPNDRVKTVTNADIDPRKGQHMLHQTFQVEENDARLDNDSESIQKIRGDDNKHLDSLPSEELVSDGKRGRRSNLILHEKEHQSVKESPSKVRRRSSTTSITKEEHVDLTTVTEGETRNIRKSLRRTPDKKMVDNKTVEDKKRKVDSQNLKFVPKRLDYSDDESPEKKKSRSLIDFPIKRNSRLPRPTLEDIREEDEDLLKKKKKSLDDFHLEEMKKKASSKKTSASKIILGDSDVDSDVSTPELWKKDLTKEKRLTRTQQKLFLMNQQLTSVSEVESPSSSPRRVRKKVDATDSPVKTPTRSSLRLQKKPPSKTD